MKQVKKLVSVFLVIATLIAPFDFTPFNAPEASAACAHRFGSNVPVISATCTADGMGFRNCTLCGYKEYYMIPARGHSMVTVPGASYRRCSVCGYIQY